MTLPLKTRLIAAVARIAQLVEQRIENPRVPGSIPGSGTISYPLALFLYSISSTGAPFTSIKATTKPSLGEFGSIITF